MLSATEQRLAGIESRHGEVASGLFYGQRVTTEPLRGVDTRGEDRHGVRHRSCSTSVERATGDGADAAQQAGGGGAMRDEPHHSFSTRVERAAGDGADAAHQTGGGVLRGCASFSTRVERAAGDGADAAQQTGGGVLRGCASFSTRVERAAGDAADAAQNCGGRGYMRHATASALIGARFRLGSTRVNLERAAGHRGYAARQASSGAALKTPAVKTPVHSGAAAKTPAVKTPVRSGAAVKTTTVKTPVKSPVGRAAAVGKAGAGALRGPPNSKPPTPLTAATGARRQARGGVPPAPCARAAGSRSVGVGGSTQ